MSKWESEAELAAAIVAWLQDLRLDVYQEVGDLDILAMMERGKRKVLWAIECKLSFNFKVIKQASSWQGVAHRVSVAVPPRRDSFAGEIACRTLGIGILHACPSSATLGGGLVREAMAPRFCRKVYPESLLVQLRDWHQTKSVAGSPSGTDRWSPFKQTCFELVRYLAAHPGITMKEAVDNVPHHYGSGSTARACLAKWIERGIVPGVEWRPDSRNIQTRRLYATKGAAI